MTRFIVTRHGQSIANAECRFAGHSDFDLSEIGKQQAELVADYLCKNFKIGVDMGNSQCYNQAYKTGRFSK